MAIRNIILEGDPMLRKKSKPVREVNDHIREIMADMLETMHEHQGVGLAAPQVGIMRRMFVAEPEPEDVYYMINPEMLEQDGTQDGAEGCLSVPDLEGMVERPQHIKIKALDLEGNEQVYDFEDFHARVMCHEYDHLDGVLYTDKASEVYDPQERYEEMAKEYADKNEQLKAALAAAGNGNDGAGATGTDAERNVTAGTDAGSAEVAGADAESAVITEADAGSAVITEADAESNVITEADAGSAEE